MTTINYDSIYRSLEKSAERFKFKIGDLSDKAIFKQFVDAQIALKQVNMDESIVFVSLQRGNIVANSSSCYLTVKPRLNKDPVVAPATSASDAPF